MSECHSILFASHSDPSISAGVCDVLERVFSKGIEQEKASKNDENSLWKAAYSECHNIIEAAAGPMMIETIEESNSHFVIHLIHSSNSIMTINDLVEALSRQIDNLQIQAWGHGDDDPYEYWIKTDQDNTYFFENNPFQDKSDDVKIFSTVYRWWHSGFLSGKKVGLLNEEPPKMKVTPEHENEKYEEWLECLYSGKLDNPEGEFYSIVYPETFSEIEIKEYLANYRGIFRVLKGEALPKNTSEMKQIKLSKELILTSHEDLENTIETDDIDAFLSNFCLHVTGRIVTKSNNFTEADLHAFIVFEHTSLGVINKDLPFRYYKKFESIEVADDKAKSILSVYLTKADRPLDSEAVRFFRAEYSWSYVDKQLLITNISVEGLEKGIPRLLNRRSNFNIG